MTKEKISTIERLLIYTNTRSLDLAKMTGMAHISIKRYINGQLPATEAIIKIVTALQNKGFDISYSHVMKSLAEEHSICCSDNSKINS